MRKVWKYRQSPVKTPDIKNIKVVTFTFLLKFPTAWKQLRQEQKFPIHSQRDYMKLLKECFVTILKVLQIKQQTSSMSLIYLSGENYN